MFKFLRTISALGRPNSHSRLSLLSQNGQVRIQRVRIVRPFFTKNRTRSIFSYLIGTSLFCYLALELTENEEEEGKNTGPRTRKPSDELVKAPFKEKFVAQDILGDVGKVGHKSRSNDETLENDDDDGEEDEDYDAEPIPEDALFIPVGFVHERPRTYYKGSDPEWQSFLEFSKDKKRKTHICSDLARLASYALSTSARFQNIMGTPMEPQMYWLDIDFPDGPPPEYERSGIEITGDYVAWTTRPISSAEVFRLRSILQPLPMLSAMWASYKVLWSLQLTRIQEVFTPGSKQDDIDAGSPTALRSLQKSAQAARDGEPDLSAGSEEPPPIEPEEEPSGHGLSYPLGQDMKAALKAFDQTLAKNWAQPSLVLERGTFLISGLVQVRGPKAVGVLSVQAVYHPRESRLVAASIEVQKVKLRKQAPKGGE